MTSFLQRYNFTPIIIWIVGIIALFLYAQLTTFRTQDINIRETGELVLAEQSLNVWVARTPESRRLGLSIVDDLDGSQGMLFIFDKQDIYNFWMKEMKFPIDIFWIDHNGIIVSVKKYAQPDDYPESYEPDEPSLYVLETVAGFADNYDVKKGDKVYLENIDL